MDAKQLFFLNMFWAKYQTLHFKLNNIYKFKLKQVNNMYLNMKNNVFIFYI